MGLIATSDHGLAGSSQKSGRAVLSLVSFLTPIISHCGISIFILHCALTMSRLLNGHPVSVQYELLLEESRVLPFVAAHLCVLLSCPQVFISVPALSSHNLPSTFTSVVDITINDSLTCKVVLGMNWCVAWLWWEVLWNFQIPVLSQARITENWPGHRTHD